METIEMDLMQAQIGELATEVSANKSKIAKIPAIPTPEDTDAGKVIKVSNTGAYELGAGGGGGSGILLIGGSWNNDHTVFTFDKTANEINTAIASGSIAFVREVLDLNPISIPMYFVSCVESYDGETDYFLIGNDAYADTGNNNHVYVEAHAATLNDYPITDFTGTIPS